MDALYVPDVKFETPELFFPNRKPPIAVSIDWTNPTLPKGLEFSVIFGRGNKDMVNGLTPVNYGSSYQERGGDFFADDSNVNAYVEYDRNGMPDLSNGFTIFLDLVLRHNHNDTAAWRSFLDAGSDSGGIGFMQANNANNEWMLRVKNGSGGWELYADSTSFVDGDRVIIAILQKAGIMSIYENGKLLATKSMAGNVVHPVVSDWRIGMSKNSPTTAKSAMSQYKKFDVFPRGLSNDEIARHSANMYGSLIPK